MYTFYRQYVLRTAGKIDVLRFKVNGYEYAYDVFPDSDEGLGDKSRDSRLVAVIGLSKPTRGKRSGIIKGWLGPTEKVLGKEMDKGHYIAHSLGGDLYWNLFPQNRYVNRGWKPEGKLFRQMERYCFENPNTFLFVRPVYGDFSMRPQSIDFGILKEENSFWIENISN